MLADGRFELKVKKGIPLKKILRFDGILSLVKECEHALFGYWSGPEKGSAGV